MGHHMVEAVTGTPPAATLGRLVIKDLRRAITGSRTRRPRVFHNRIASRETVQVENPHTGPNFRSSELAADTATRAASADGLISVGGRACDLDDVADIPGLRLRCFSTSCTLGASRSLAGALTSASCPEETKYEALAAVEA
jgi:hypothetical protein